MEPLDPYEGPSAGPSTVPLSPSNPSLSQSPDVSLSSTRKRLSEGPQRAKNLQACDRCRTKKIKYAPSARALANDRCVPVDSRRDICHSCHSSRLGCTFELPLTASRTKRVRRGLGAEAQGPLSTSHDGNSDDESVTTRSPRVVHGHGLNTPVTSSSSNSRRESQPQAEQNRLPTVHREGPTSLSFILHAMPTIPLGPLDEYDRTNGYVMRLSSGPGHAGSPENENSQDGWIDVSTAPGVKPTREVLDVLRSDSWGEVASRLVEKFLGHVVPVIPIVVRGEVGVASGPLLHAMAAVAAARSDVSPLVFEALRYLTHKEVNDLDMTCVPTRENIQVLLTLCLVDELAIGTRPASWAYVIRSRLSAAIRHARDLGLDVAASGPDARIWRCARILDVWHAAKCGTYPLAPVTSLPPRMGDDFHSQLTYLSLLFGRLLALMYGPNGIRNADNLELLHLRDTLAAWKQGLPQHLQADSVWSGLESGLLQLLHAAIRFLLYRPVMRWSFIAPNHIELNSDVPVWLENVETSRAAIEWAANQEEVAGLMFFGPYALSVACCVQYHTWARRGEWDGAALLAKARREAGQRWLARIPEGHLPLLRKQLAPIEFLCHITTLHREPTAFDGPRGLNPTPGVLNRLAETSISGVTFLRDASLPHGGVLVATQQAAREIKDLPPGTVIIGGNPDQDAMGVGLNGVNVNGVHVNGGSRGSGGSETPSSHHGGGGGGITPNTAAGYLNGLLQETPTHHRQSLPPHTPQQLHTPLGWEVVASMIFPPMGENGQPTGGTQ